MQRLPCLLLAWLGIYSLWAFNQIAGDEYMPSLPGRHESLQMLIEEETALFEDTEVDCSSKRCSWLDYADNVDFQGEYPNNPPLYELSDLALHAKVAAEEVQLSCLPEKFGYSHDEAEKLFPYIGYKTCKELGFKDNILQVDLLTNTLTLRCPGNSGFYWVGGTSSEERLGLGPPLTKRFEYNGPVALPDDVEYFFGSCAGNRTAEAAVYVHRKNAEVERRVKAAMKLNQQEAQEKFGESLTRPLTVLVLTLDSLSRRQFYRKLPLTVAYLNTVDSAQFKVHDFRIHNVIGDNSYPNVYPIWTGKVAPHIPEFFKTSNSKKNEDLIGEAAIWSYLRQKGWVTLLGQEFCQDYFSKAIGRKPNVDHLMNNFWCSAQKLAKYR
mmetsp:Transcript_3561/g.7636  ORF Transcript_3561/g.7636 Transcript_3561/m.7636 type:complete len:381 (+) Transcript_3561:39-1181(+)